MLFRMAEPRQLAARCPAQATARKSAEGAICFLCMALQRLHRRLYHLTMIGDTKDVIRKIHFSGPVEFD